MALVLGFQRPSFPGLITAPSSSCCRKRIVFTAASAAPDSSNVGENAPRKFSLPNTLEESIEQARVAYKQAIKEGYTRLQLEMPLPLIGATDLDDWPGGIQQQFKAAAPMVTALLSGGGELKSYVIDVADAVGAWENEDIALVLFPTADSLSSVQSLATASRPLLLINVQWRDGQVISDFGFGADKKTKEDFVKSFDIVYYLQQLRIAGNNVRIYKRYPGTWQVFVTDGSGESKCVAVETEKPSYKRLESILKEAQGSSGSSNWLSRLLQELKFNADSMKQQ